MPDTSDIKTKILSLADHCVKCGLCSAQCPTYLLYQNENESPRGRIALAQALATDSLPAEAKIKHHLSNCLQCRRCEAICPSQVAYGELINTTNDLLHQNDKNRLPLKNYFFKKISLLTHKQWISVSKYWQVITGLGFKYFLKAMTPNRSINQLIPNKTSKIAVSKSNSNKEKVFLFTGCSSHIFDSQTMQCCIDILEACEVSVLIPEAQRCCGAIASRLGQSETEKQCQLSNELAFSDKNNIPILYFTPGCGSKLTEYPDNFLEDTNDKKFADRALDIQSFILKNDMLEQLKFRPLNKKVLIFTACSERNVLKQANLSYKLLDYIPELTIINSTNITSCCGASGTHLLTHGEQAKQILAPILEHIEQSSPDIIISSNYPCLLHIQSGLGEKNLDIPTMHPIELLFNQLIRH